MAYNKAKEEYRWNQWKAEEEKILREQGVDEETIQKLREYDWDDFNAERRFREHQTSLLDCMELLLEEKRNQRVPAGERRSPAGYRGERRTASDPVIN